MKQKTNIDVVKDIMTYSNYGALAQMFVIDALMQHSARVAAAPLIENSLINGAAWKGVAQEISDKLNAKYGKEK